MTDPSSTLLDRRRSRAPGWLGLGLALVFVFLLGSRLTTLGWRGFHHDESLHSFFSWRLAQQGLGAYSYDPVYHGPFLYHIGGLIFRLLPDSDATARLPFALAGIVAVLLVFTWRRWIGWGGVLALGGMFTLSPVICYYSRFAREDVYMALWLIGQITAGLYYFRTLRLRYMMLLALFTVLQYCTKESSYIHHFFLVAYLALWCAVCAARNPKRLARAVFIKYLPLTRFVVLTSGFMCFTFFYVAVDSRIGPSTSLVKGLAGLAGHLIALVPGERPISGSGYFTALGREGVRENYMLCAAGLVCILMVAIETAAFALARRRRPLATVTFLFSAALLYLLVAEAILTLHSALAPEASMVFIRRFREQIVARGIVIALTVAVFAPAEWMDKRTGWQRRWRRRTMGWAALAGQITLVLLVGGLLFSSFGTHPEGLRAGLYSYLNYWFRQQTGEYRIWGTWWYYLPRLALYELPALALILVFGPLALLRRAERSCGGGDGVWRAIPGPFLGLACWLSGATVAVYALLNEKVPWLLMSQSLALNMLAAFLLTDWIAKHRRPGARRLVALSVFLGGLALFAGWQHALAVFLRPNDPSELINYTSTTPQFARQARRVVEMADARATLGLPPLRISVEGEAAWPSTWYFRRLDAAYGCIDPARDVIIADDTPSNRAIFAALGEGIWQVEPVPLRGWWLWHGNASGLPGGTGFVANVRALLLNAPNDHRDAFPRERRAELEAYSTGFASQVAQYVFGRRAWYPTAAQNVLVAYRCNEPGERGRAMQVVSVKRLKPVAVLSESSATSGSLACWRGLAVTREGNIAAVESAQGCVDVLSPAGKRIATIGGGVLTTASGGPSDVACDGEGNLFVADTWGHAIRKFSADGRLLASTTIGREQGRRVALFGPRGLALGPDGRLFVTDTGNHAVRVYDAQLRALGSWGGRGNAPGQFVEPVGIAVEADGHIFVADAGNSRIERFTPEGAFDSQVYWQDAAADPAKENISNLEPRLVLLPDGRLALSLSSFSQIRIVDWQAAVQEVIQIDDVTFREPLGLACADSGAIWVSDRSSGRIARVTVEP